MLHTLEEAREDVGKYVGSGSCNVEVVNKAINNALERLMDQQPWECLQRTIRLCTCRNCVTLPYESEAILAVDLNGMPSRVYGRMYQFLPSGPGEPLGAGSGLRDLVDMGDNHPIMFDIPTRYSIDDQSANDVFPNGLRISAFSTADKDTTLTMTVVGRNYMGETITEVIPVQKWHGGIEGDLLGRWDGALKLSTAVFKEIDRVIKPVSKGYVCLYAVEPARDFMFTLAKYHPAQTIPGFRRYRITNKNYSEYTTILALVRQRLVPLVLDTDILPIDSIQPIKLAVMAISAENAKDMATATTYLSAAISALNKREEAKTLTVGTPVILNMDHRTSIGRRISGRRL